MTTDRRLPFVLEARDPGGSARAGTFATRRDRVETPVFMPVATFAALRNQLTRNVEQVGFPVLLANTYHLLLRPGPEVFQAIGGIHRFMHWSRSVLTDSGGFQLFSLAEKCRIGTEEARFQSYIDGREIRLSPETSIATQKAIGSDIMMALDHCVSARTEESLCGQAVERTARWAERSLAARGDSDQALMGIVQGGCSPRLRKTSAAQITSLPFDGYAIGGLAVGESEEQRKDITALTAGLLPEDCPRYLMGVGTPLDLLEAVHRGMDMFDCIIPGALGQQGTAFTSRGRLHLRRSVYRMSGLPLDEACSCPTCRHYSRAYLHHLIKSGEFLGASLVGFHNLTFYYDLMRRMREQILLGGFTSFHRRQQEELKRTDEENPPRPPMPRLRRQAMELGEYEIVQARDGSHRIRHKPSGEWMHSVNDPQVEARALYAEQADLGMRSAEPGRTDLVIWDVGLGAATNAMATLMKWKEVRGGAAPGVRLKLISFEKDLDSLRLSLRHNSLFPHLRHGAPAAVLREGCWLSSALGCEWVLRQGDFQCEMETADPPDCIFYDPFSFQTDPALWSLPVLEQVFRRARGPDTCLFTYSAATRVRSVLLAAGFFVAAGCPTGPKSETTIAACSPGTPGRPLALLGRDWLARFERSHTRSALGRSPEEAEEIVRRVRGHAQFQPLRAACGPDGPAIAPASHP